MTMLDKDDGTPENVDLEAGAGVAQRESTTSNNVGPAAAAPAAADNAPGNGSGNGNGNGGNGVHSSSWSAREVVQRAEGLDRVRVTPAWSLAAALGEATPSSTSSPAPPSQASVAANIVRQVAGAQAFGLVLCGCTGSGGLATTSPARNERGAGAEPGTAGGSTGEPLTGTRSVHGKWPSMIGGSRHGQRPRSLSLMTRSWHGKSRHHARGSHRAREAATAHSDRFVGGGGGDDGGSRPRQSGLASAVNMVINHALWDLVGDVAANLLRSEPAPAVLAVRASKSAMSATV